MSAVSTRYKGIQVLRAVLFVGIVAFHSGVPGSQILWGGVEVFFVISSYFLTKKLSKIPANELKIIPTVRHRITRLIPVYYLVIIGTFLIVAVLKKTLAISDLLIHGVFSQNINWMITGYQSELLAFTAHTWTISIEIYLFLIWLVVFKVLKSNRARTIFNGCSILCAIAWRIITTITIGDAMITSLCPIAHMDTFAIGSLLAMSESKNEKKNHFISGLFCLCGLVFIIVSIGVTAQINNTTLLGAYTMYKSSINYLNHPFTCNVYLGFSLLTVGLVRYSKEIVGDSKLSKALAACGNITYSAYLIHYPINVVMRYVCDNSWIVFVITTIISIVGSFVIERILRIITLKIKIA